MFISLISISVFAFQASATEPYALDSNRAGSWEKLIEHLIASGESMSNEHGDFIILEEVTPADTEKPRIANYLTGVGFRDSSGQFYLDHVRAVWENWQLEPDGSWKIDQWLFKVAEDGELESFDHLHRFKSPDRLGVIRVDIPATDSEAEAFWDKLRSGWFEKISRH